VAIDVARVLHGEGDAENVLPEIGWPAGVRLQRRG
jgi:hypothetical protein